MSHEFRAPLTLILAPLEYLLDKGNGAFSAAQRNSLKTTHNNPVRLLQRVTGLLDFSKLEAAKVEVKRETVQIVLLTRAILADFEPSLKQKGLAVHFQPNPAEACVQIDHYLYERILFNLMSNAAKFTQSGGAISISLSVQGERLQLTVADTGIGILEDELPNLFQKFRQIESSSTRRFEGTGLGLALVKEFAELLGGTVSVASALGRGSSFTVVCLAPNAESPGISKPGTDLTQRYEVEPAFAEPPPAAGSGQRPRVLIAEDNAELAFYMASLLREFSDTKIAADGDEAWKLVQEWSPHLVLADVMMPKRDGLKTGWPRTNWVGRHYTELVHPDDVEITNAAFQQASRGEWPARLEIRFRCRSGEYLLGEVIAGPHFQKGRVTGVFACIRDITQRKRDEIALRESEERFRQLNVDLERRVHERTAQLEAANRDLENEIAERRLTEALLRESEERFRLLVLDVKDYAIYWIDPDGRVAGWNAGAERIKGYHANEIIGQPFSVFHTVEDNARGWLVQLLKTAQEQGRVEDEGWRVRKDGTRFWANTVITALRDVNGRLRGFAKITRDDTERKWNQQAVQESKLQLEAANKELEAFSYSVSHDLRAPLRAIDGFALALPEDCADRLNDTGQKHLKRVRDAAQRMGHLIDGLLTLARVTRTEMSREAVNLSSLAQSILDELRQTDPKRDIELAVQPELTAWGDARLLRSALENLFDNAWKFSRKSPQARIEFGGIDHQGRPAFFIRDNGAGFDMAYSDKLFGAFQRLHAKSEFEGTGIGLATVQRIIHRHGGSIWAEGTPGAGAAFYFTLPSGSGPA